MAKGDVRSANGLTAIRPPSGEEWLVTAISGPVSGTINQTDGTVAVVMVKLDTNGLSGPIKLLLSNAIWLVPAAGGTLGFSAIQTK